MIVTVQWGNERIDTTNVDVVDTGWWSLESLLFDTKRSPVNRKKKTMQEMGKKMSGVR